MNGKARKLALYGDRDPRKTMTLTIDR